MLVCDDRADASGVSVQSVPTTSHELGRRLRDPLLEACVRANTRSIERDASLVGLDRRTFETQIRLHWPSVPPKLVAVEHHAEAYETIRSVALVRAAGIRQELDQTELLANSSLLLPKDYVVKKDLTLESDDGSRLELSFRRVLPSVGHVYQSRLHYLRSARGDTYLHFGLFLPGAVYPLTYVALSVCDRPYMSDGLLASQLQCDRKDCLVITRMYGLPGAPQNLMSVTLKHVIRVLRWTSMARLVLTAYNPLLGFTGAAFRASGFRPFAIAPVSYQYTRFGEFTTRRRARYSARPGHSSPPNVLTVRGVDKSIQREIRDQLRLTEISMNDYVTRASKGRKLRSLPSDDWMRQLLTYRQILEDAWSRRTIHPSYLADDRSGSTSRGQCGVSSVWLARELRRCFGVEANYCYGDLIFHDGTSKPVAHHCWVEIGEGIDPTRLVVDLTCDQAESLDQPVLCAPHDNLVKQGMEYQARTRLTLDELPADRVWHRFMALSDAVDCVLDSVR